MPILSRRALLGRLSVIGLVVAALAAGFAYAGGWLDPARLAPAKIVDALEAHDGLHPGFRRAHAKGLCLVGQFESNGAGVALSKAAVFPKGEVPVFGRFSLPGGNPYAADGRVIFHSLALNFTLPDGELWRTAMNDMPIFLVSTPEDFLTFQQITTADPATGKPDAAKISAFLAEHPETQAFLAWLRDQPLPSSFANSTYYSINAFRFIDAAGRVRFVRWSFLPETPFEAQDKDGLAALDKNFLYDEVIGRLAQGPLRWRLMITVAGPADAVDDATKPWPANRETLEVGTLVVQRAVLEDEGPCRDVTFDPLILPSGMAASDDPLLSARSATYAVSLTRRSGEAPEPSALASDPAAQGAKP